MFPLYIMHIMLKDVNDNATFQYIFICFRTKNKFITILIGFVSLIYDTTDRKRYWCMFISKIIKKLKSVEMIYNPICHSKLFSNKVYYKIFCQTMEDKSITPQSSYL